jgi:chromosome segregation ATPase
VKGYVKKQKPDVSRPAPSPSQEPIKNFLFAPQVQLRQQQPAGPVPPQESMLLQRLEEMTRRIDLMQNSQKLSSTTQLLPGSNSPHRPMPPQFQTSAVNMAPRPQLDMRQSEFSPSKHRNGGFGDTSDSRFDSDGMRRFDYSGQPQSNNDVDELTRLVGSLQSSLREAQEEYVRAVMRADSESNERQDLEKRNFELNGKLMEARQALKETQGALQSVQLATDHLTNKREQREQYINELKEENGAYMSRIAVLESKLQDAEDAILESNTRRDHFLHQIQDQLSACQDEMFQSQAELTAVNGQKMQVESELDSVRLKLAALETKMKTSENAMETTYKAKVSTLEEKCRSLSEKLVGEKQLTAKLETVEEQLKGKTKSAKAATETLKQTEAELHESQLRVRALESKLHDCANLIQELEFKLQTAGRQVETEKQNLARLQLLEDELTEKDVALKTLHQRNYELEANLTESEVRVANTKSALTEKTTALQDMEFKLRSHERAKVSGAQAESRIIVLEQELSEKKAALVTANTSLKRVEAHLEEAESKCKSVEAMLHDKSTKLREVQFQYETLEQQTAITKQAIQKLDDLENELSEKKHKLNLESQTIRSLQLQLEESNARVIHLEESVKGKKDQVHDVEMRLKNAELENLSDKQKMSRISSLEQELAEKTSELQVRSTRLQDVEASLEDKSSFIETLEHSLKEKVSKMTSLEKQLDSTERELSTLKLHGTNESANQQALEKKYRELDARMQAVVHEKHELAQKVELLEQLVENAAEIALELDVAEEQRDTAQTNLKEAEKKIQNLTKETTRLANEILEKDGLISDQAEALAKAEEEAKKPKLVKRKSSKALRDTGSSSGTSSKKLTIQQSIKEEPPPAAAPAPVVSRSNTMNTDDSDGSDLDDNATPLDEESWSLLRNLAGQGQAVGNKHQTGRKSSLAVLVDYMGSTRRDVDKLKEEKKQLKVEISQWNDDFKAKNGREATREEKETIAADLYIRYQRVSTNLKKKETKLQKSEKTFNIKRDLMPAIKEKESLAQNGQT